MKPNPSDRTLLDALMRHVSNERIYRNEGITIGMLATKTCVPPNTNATVINQQLGYRPQCKRLSKIQPDRGGEGALAEPSQAEVARDTMRWNAGFRRSAPFNRAFKATTAYPDPPKIAASTRSASLNPNPLERRYIWNRLLGGFKFSSG